MKNPFWHNPEYALKQIRSIANDWKNRAQELTYIDEKGYKQKHDDYNSELNSAFQSSLHILKCVYEDEECKMRY